MSTKLFKKSKRKKECAPKNISKSRSKWGGPRPNSGGARAGSGRPQRKPSPWPKNTDLKSSIGLNKFLCHLLKVTWQENVLDPRTIGTINNIVRLLLTLRNWPYLNMEIMNDPVLDKFMTEKEKEKQRLQKEKQDEKRRIQDHKTERKKYYENMRAEVGFYDHDL